MFERGKLGVSSMCEIKTKEKERDDVCRMFGVDFERRRGVAMQLMPVGGV